MDAHIRFDPSGPTLFLLDQRRLPHERVIVACRTVDEVAEAIRAMVVRGAPAIGITAAYGMAIAALRAEPDAAARLAAARPTAVNLQWAIDQLSRASDPVAAALAMHEQDVAINRAIGAHGARLLPARARVYTHCNAGALATGGYGTALGIVRAAAANIDRVYAGETRPYLQGARLTAYELQQERIPCTLVTDSMAAALFAAGKVDCVIVGADRVAANGDVANKIGTLGLAVLARHYGIPFYVAVPTSTLDLACPDGAAIPIEERAASEVLGFGGQRWAADVDVFNPSFDVTPAALVTAWVTEDGLWSPR